MYLEGVRPRRTPGALGFGSLFHVGLEQWWLSWADWTDKLTSIDQPLWLAISAMGAKFSGLADESDLDEFDLVRAEELMRGYHFRWLNDMAGMTVLSVEESFQTKLINPETGRPSQTFLLAGKLDAIVGIGNEVYIVEHKTTSSEISPGSDYWQRLRIDGQVSTYYEGGRALGHDVFGCIYDVVRKPSTQPHKATPPDKRKYRKDGALYANQRDSDETPAEYRERLRADISLDPERYYQRGDVHRLESDRAEFAADAWFTAQSMRMAEKLNAHPRNPESCVRYGRFCSFFDVCTGADSLDNETRFRRTEVVHEELQPQPTPKEEA